MNKTNFLWLLTGVLLLAAVLRIDGLNAQGLWGDEGWSVEFSADPDPQAVALALVPDLHPPLYFMTLAWWREVAGDDEIALRLPAVFAALVTVATVARLTENHAAGVVAAVVLAIADKHIVLSQEVRQYPAALMLTALSSWFFLRTLRRPTRANVLIYAALIIASLYTHYYTALVILVHALFTLLMQHPRRWPLVRVMGLASLAFLPWAFVAVQQLQIRSEGILHSMPLNADTLDFLLVDFLGRPVVLLGLLVVLGLWTAVQRRSQPGMVAALWLAVPIAVTVLVYPVVTLVTDRNLALLLVPIALLAGQGAVLFRPVGRIALVVLMVGNGLASLDSYYEHPPWREMAEYVATRYPAGEPVFMDVVGGDKALRYHLEQELPPDAEIVSLNQVRIDQGIYFLGVWDQYLQQNDGFWVAYWVNQDREWDIREPLEQAGFVRTATHRTFHLGNPIEWHHYDRLPELNEVRTRYDDTIRLHRVQYPAATTADMLNVSLWWSTTRSLSISYSVSVFLLDDTGRLVTQHDGPPQDGAAPTNTWAVDAVVLDTHQVDLSSVTAGTYQLAVKLYDSATGAVLPAGQDNAEYYIVDEVQIADTGD
jgi:hypothetical protein